MFHKRYKLPQQEHCAICLGRMRKGNFVAKTYCGHLFHFGCIEEWHRRVWNCPVCRTDSWKFRCGVCNNECEDMFICAKCEDYCCLDCYVFKVECPRCHPPVYDGMVRLVRTVQTDLPHPGTNYQIYP